MTVFFLFNIYILFYLLNLLMLQNSTDCCVRRLPR